MNILVTGAAGFIGFHLCLALKKQGYFVIGLDNFNSYYDISLKRKRASLLKEMSIDIIEKDIRDKKDLKKLIENNNISHIVNLAAQAGVRHSIKSPNDYIHTNIEGFVSLLETAKEFQSKNIKIIYASSSSVYGNNKKTPFDTNDCTNFPTNLYGATKKANELIAYAYHHLYNISFVGLRYFTVYGPWGRPDMAYFKFTKNIINDEPIDIYNNGEMKRDFTYIDDIISGTIAAIKADISFDIFNLGNSQPVNLLDFISLLEQKIGKKAKKNFLPFQKGEVLETFADINKSHSALGYTPKTSLDQGLNSFVAWYKKYYK